VEVQIPLYSQVRFPLALWAQGDAKSKGVSVRDLTLKATPTFGGKKEGEKGYQVNSRISI
jgi:hypothetical protein